MAPPPTPTMRSVRSDCATASATRELPHRVVIGADLWGWTTQDLANQLSVLSASNRAPAIHDMLHGKYTVGPPITVPFAGTYYELRKK